MQLSNTKVCSTALLYLDLTICGFNTFVDSSSFLMIPSFTSLYSLNLSVAILNSSWPATLFVRHLQKSLSSLNSSLRRTKKDFTCLAWSWFSLGRSLTAVKALIEAHTSSRREGFQRAAGSSALSKSRLSLALQKTKQIATIYYCVTNPNHMKSHFALTISSDTSWLNVLTPYCSSSNQTEVAHIFVARFARHKIYTFSFSCSATRFHLKAVWIPFAISSGNGNSVRSMYCPVGNLDC